MNAIQALWNWFVYSSKDPAKLSLTLRGAIPFAVLFLGLANIPHDTAEFFLNDLAGQLVVVTVKAAEVGTGAVALYGFARKIWNTVKEFCLRFFV